MERQQRPEIFYREMTFDRAALDESNRTVQLSFSSETPVVRRSWLGDEWQEILRHDADALDLKRLNEVGVLLYQHSSYNVIGRIEKAWLDSENKRGMAIVRFDEDPQSEQIYQKVRSGTLKGVSVGYRVLNDDWENIRKNQVSTCGRFTGPCEVAKRWTPYEISIVTIPADASVGVGRSAEANLLTNFLPIFQSISRRLTDIQERLTERNSSEPSLAPEHVPEEKQWETESFRNQIEILKAQL